METHVLERRAIFLPTPTQWSALGLSVGATVLFLVFMFYWNRLLARLVFWLLRLKTWDADSNGSVWINAESVQVSLLAGRIMIRDFKYHSANQSIRAVRCFISWRYWLRQVRERDDTHPRSLESGEDEKENHSRPCRILIRLEGVEWIMYNRTMVFDDVLRKAQEGSKNTVQGSNGPGMSRTFPPPQDQIYKDGYSQETGQEAQVPGATLNSASGQPERYSPFAFRITQPIADLSSRLWKWLMALLPRFDSSDLLPIEFEAKKGAIIFGNHSMESRFIISFGSGTGTYGVAPCRSKFDEYKQFYNFDFRSVTLKAEENQDYHHDMVENGRRLHYQCKRQLPHSVLSYSFNGFLNSMRHFSFNPLQPINTKKPAQPAPWAGLSAFMTTAEKEEQKRKEAEEAKRLAEARRYEVGPEYAIVRQLLDTPRLEVVYYADVAGLVPTGARRLDGIEIVDIGNGDVAPQWGVELYVYGGTINYGPWADRERAQLQKAFSPPSFTNVIPTPQLKANETRVCTEFRLFVELREATELRIPCRESSKDWLYDEVSESKRTGQRPTRTAAQLSCKLGNGSTVNCTMPMVASPTGYDTCLDVHLQDVSVESSLNGKVFLEASSCRVICHLPTPPLWNAERQWTFDIVLQQPTIFLLRDHINLFTDLGKDWSAGPPSQWSHFIPMLYRVRVTLKKYNLSLYLNDHNIIRSPTDPQENALLTLRGPSLESQVDIPSNHYRSTSTTVPFWIESSDQLEVHMTLPRWDSRYAHLTTQLSDIGRIGSLRLDASYLYHGSVRDDYLDRLRLDIHARNVAYKAFGWTVRHSMILQQNYFGSYTHFQTGERLDEQDGHGDPVEEKYRPGHSNNMEVLLDINLSDGVVAVPQSLLGYEAREDSAQPGVYGIGACALATVPEIQLGFRLCDDFMEVNVNIYSIGLQILHNCPDDELWERGKGLRKRHKKDAITVQDVSIMVLHLFGPPPRHTTYACIWEIDVGTVKGSITPQEAQGISLALSSFILSFEDELNAPAEELTIPVDPDATFLRVNLASVGLILGTDQVKVEASLPQGLTLSSNDLATLSYQKANHVRLPRARVRCLLRDTSAGDSWLETASVTLDLNVDAQLSSLGWQEARNKQLSFIQAEDRATRRIPFAYERLRGRDAAYSYHGLVVLRHLSVPGWPSRSSRDTKPLPNITNNLHQQTSFESIDDTSFSMIDSDTRLALSRPVSPYPGGRQFNDNQNQTDDSEGPSSPESSVQSDDRDPPSSAQDQLGWPHLDHYWNVVRRFQHMQGPNTLSQSSSFILTSDPSPAGRAAPPLTVEGDETLASQTLGSEDGKLDGLGNNIIKVTSQYGVDATLSPLVLHAVKILLPAWHRNTASLEMELDIVMAQVQGMSVTATPTNSPTFNISLPAVRLRAIQSIMSVVEAEALQAPFDEIQSPSFVPPAGPRIISVINLHVIQPSFNGRVGGDGRCAMLGAKKATLELGTYHSPVPGIRFRKMRPSATQILLLSLDDSRLQFDDEVQARLGNVNVEFRADSPAAIMATAEVGRQIIKQASSTINKWSTSATSRTRYITWAVLEATDKATSNPFAQIPTPEFVKRGRPKQLRSDPSWAILNHARQKLAELPEKERARIVVVANDRTRRIPTMTTSDMSAVFKREWQEWTADLKADALDDLPLLKLLYSSKPTSEKPDHLPPMSVRTGFFGFKLVDENKGEGSQVRLGPFSVDLVERHQHLLLPGADASATSIHRVLSSTQSIIVRHWGGTCDLGRVSIVLSPALLPFVGRIYRARRILGGASKVPSSPRSPRLQPSSFPKAIPTSVVIDISVHLHDFNLVTTAHNFSFEGTLRRPTLVLNGRFGSLSPAQYGQSSADKAATLCLSWDRFQLQVKEHADRRQYTLADFAMDGLDLSVAISTNARELRTVRATVGMKEMHLAIPRHITRLFQSAELWYDGYFRQQIAPFKELITRKSPPRPKRIVSFKTIPNLKVDVQVVLELVEVHLHVVLGTWGIWRFKTVTLSALHHPVVDGSSQVITSGMLEVASQVVIAQTFADPDDKQSLMPQFSFTWALPSMHISVDYRNEMVRILGILNFFEIHLTANTIDTLVRVSRQLVSSDLDPLLHLFSGTKQRQELREGKDLHIGRPELTSSVDIRLRSNGLRFVLKDQSQSSLCILDIERVGFTTADLKQSIWDIDVRNLALSAAKGGGSNNPGFDRRYRLAYMVVDVSASSKLEPSTSEQRITVHLSKVHAVFQAAALGVLGDLFDAYQVEVSSGRDELARQRSMRRRRRKESRLRPLEAKENRSAATTWLEQRTIVIDISNVGAAIPLTFGMEGISSIMFQSQRGEAGNARVHKFACQFVDNFDQGIAGHFDGQSHLTHNRLLYPEVIADLSSRVSASAREWFVDATVDGFELDMDPTIASRIFSLLDVYRFGAERLEQLATILPPSETIQTPPDPPPVRLPTDQSLRRTHVLATLLFHSGHVRLHRETIASSRSQTFPPFSYRPGEDVVAELKLPRLSLWTEWRPPITALKKGSSKEVSAGSLAFRATIHSSRNILRPAILQFASSLMNRVETRLSTAPSEPTKPMAPQVPSQTESYSKDLGSLQLTFSLRINKSTLEFTCQPDANIVAGVHWESGGFIATVIPGAKEAGFAGSVQGLTVNLRHGYLSQDCFTASTKDLAFNAKLSAADDFKGNHTTTSLVLEADIKATAMFARLQDMLIFKAVWLDGLSNRPVPLARSETASERKTRPVSDHQSRIDDSRPIILRPWVTTAMFKIRQLETQLDLGPSISTVSLSMESIILQTLLTEALSELFFSVGQLDLQARRSFSGHARVPEFFFRTARSRFGNFAKRQDRETMLNIDMSSGPLDIMLAHENRTILLYHSQPLRVSIYDDWSRRLDPTDKQLHLHFSVFATRVDVVGLVTTVAIFLDLAYRLRTLLQAQYDGATRESGTFRAMSAAKRDLLEVATALLPQTEGQESGRQRNADLQWAVIQHMSVRLQNLTIGVLQDRFDNAQRWGKITLEGVEATLERRVAGQSDPTTSTVHLALGLLDITRQMRKPTLEQLNALEWNQSSFPTKGRDSGVNSVITVPAMQVTMQVREQTRDDGTPILEYDLWQELGEANRGLVRISTFVPLYEWARDMYAKASRSTSDALERFGYTSAIGELPATIRKDLGFKLAETDAKVTYEALKPFVHNRKLWKPGQVLLDLPQLEQVGRLTPGQTFAQVVLDTDLRQSIGVWVHDFATTPISELLGVLLTVYTKQLRLDKETTETVDVLE